MLALNIASRIAGNDVTVISGLSERATTPLGALADTLARLGLGPDIELTDAVSALSRSVASTLVVDDAPRLDPTSAEAIRRLITGFGVAVLATARDGENLPDALAELERAGLIHDCDLDALTIVEVTELLTARFRVPPREADAQSLHLHTGGNPLHLRILVESAIESGTVLHRGDYVEISTDSPPAELRKAVSERVAQLSNGERRLLSLVALTQPIAPETLAAFDKSSALRGLARRGLVAVEPHGGRLRIGHPLVAEELPETQDVAHDAAGILRASGEPTRRFAAVELARRVGQNPGVDELVWAARFASAHGDHQTAALLATAASTSPAPRDQAFAAHLAAAHHHSLANNIETAEQHFETARTLAREPSERAALAGRWGEHLALRMHDPAAAIEQAERVREDLTASVSVSLDTDIWRWRQLGDRPLHDPTDPELRGAVSRVVAASMRGEPSSVSAELATLSESQPDSPTQAALARITLGLHRTVELRSQGQATEAAAFLEASRASAPVEVGFFTLMLASQHAGAGRLSDAESLAALAIEQLRRWDGGELLAFALALQATLVAQKGNTVDAARLLSELGDTISGVAVLQAAQCRAHIHAAQNRAAEAAQEILTAVEHAATSGYRFFGALMLGEALRFGEVHRTASLALKLCEGAAEECAPALAVRDLALALRDGATAEVEPAARRLAENGLAPVAADGGALALRLPSADDVRRRIHTLVTSLAADVDAPLLQLRDTVALTPRELEVARAAANRLRAREIAELLNISARTVENQLYSVYRKLGVASRDELRDALADAGLDPGRPSGAPAATAP